MSQPDEATYEVCVVGALLTATSRDAEAIERVTSALTPRDFVSAALAEIYDAVVAVRTNTSINTDGGVDPFVLRDELGTRGALERVGGLDYLVELYDLFAPPASLEYYTERVRAEATRRQARSALQAGLLELEHASPADALEQVRRRLSELDGGGPTGFPAPETVHQILSKPVEEEDWLAEGLVPAGGNLLFVGPPKSLKTTGYMELAVAGATGTSFFHRHGVPRQVRTGIVLMEGVKRYAARRIERLALSRGKRAADLDEWLYIWYRPPFRLDQPGAVRGLAAWARKLALDILFLDPWMSIRGVEVDSNQQDDVRPQLDAYSSLRDQLPGLTTQLTVHAGKTVDGKGRKVTDAILGSTAFGAWFDCALAFDRRDEESSVSVRTEYKDLPSLAPFALKAEDQEPATSSNNWTPQGWYRITVASESPVELERRTKAAALVPAVTTFLQQNPGCSMRELRMGVEGRGEVIDAALRVLTEQGKAYVDRAEKRGMPDRVFLAGSFAEESE